MRWSEMHTSHTFVRLCIHSVPPGGQVQPCVVGGLTWTMAFDLHRYSLRPSCPHAELVAHVTSRLPGERLQHFL